MKSSDFDRNLRNHDLAVVLFYATWCPYSQRFKPEYIKAAAELKKSHPKVLIAAVDVPKNNDLGKRFKIKGYPHIKWFENGKEVEDF